MEKQQPNMMGEFAVPFLFEDYIKVAKLNIVTGEYRFLKTIHSNAVDTAMKEEHFRNYVRCLGESGQIHPDDAASYIKYIDSNHTRKNLVAGNRIAIHGMRYKLADDYIWMSAEITAPNDYDVESNPWVVFTTREMKKKLSYKTDPLKKHLGFHKIMKADLSNDLYETVKVYDRDICSEDSFPPTLSEWIKIFAQTGVYDDDRQQFISSTDVGILREHFSKSSEPLKIKYRRVYADTYRWVEMEIIPSIYYSAENQSVMVYIHDCEGNEEPSYLLEYYSSRDLASGMWNEFRFNSVCEEFDSNAEMPVGVIYASAPDKNGKERLEWLMINELDLEKCYRISDNEFIALFMNQCEEDVLVKSGIFRRRAEQIEDQHFIVGWAWERRPTSIPPLIETAKQKGIENS